MNNDFQKFQSIPNENNTKTIEYFEHCGFCNDSVLWYATEKIHGTNFSFVSDSFVVQFAQRSDFIKKDESFFDFRNSFQIENISHKVLQLAKYLGHKIQLVTEYYGQGIIQKGAIKYRNGHSKGFIAFDILNLDTNTFIPYPLNFQYLDKFSIPRVKVLSVGTFDEMMLLDTHFKSDLAAQNGIDTFAEGIVMKPCIDIRLPVTNDRVILKRISEAFAENRPKRIEKTRLMPQDNEPALIESKDTEIRLSKVAAKFGIAPSEKAQFAALLIEYANDIRDEIKSENGITIHLNAAKKQLKESVKAFFNPQNSLF